MNRRYRTGRSGTACIVAAVLVTAAAIVVPALAAGAGHGDGNVDAALQTRLRELGYTGRTESTLTDRLGRRLDPSLVDTGRNLWFDTITSLNGDNSCAGCHSPTNGFGDTQSIAIGIDSNRVVGPGRSGPRNQRRAPMVANTAFYPALMLNDRFASLSGDPFDPSAGFLFPAPEGLSLSYLPHLLDAQAFIPPTERTESAGFTFVGDNDAIRAEVTRRIGASPGYQKLFARSFPQVTGGSPITYDMIARALAEFEFSLTFANAPIDRFARGEENALTPQEKSGALLFFGAAGCVSCHQVSGRSNEMFSDFREHVAGVPQLVPSDTNVGFDGPQGNEDFGREQFTGDATDRYAFRTSPLRNVALQAAFMHDGAFTSLDAAIRYHLDALAAAGSYSPAANGVDADLAGPIGPMQPILARLDPLLTTPKQLSEMQIEDIVAFVRDGLLDPDARPDRLRHLVPKTLPSGRAPLTFQFDR